MPFYAGILFDELMQIFAIQSKNDSAFIEYTDIFPIHKNLFKAYIVFSTKIYFF